MNVTYKDDITENLLEFLSNARREHIKAVYDSIREVVNAAEALTKMNMSGENFRSATASGRMRSNGKIYTIPLERGVRSGVYNDNGMPTGLISILGDTKQDDGTWRLRFFNGGTVERFIAPHGGKKHSIGHIEPTYFFDNAISSMNEMAPSIIQAAIDKVMTSNK